jgi:hypothetical protein
MSSSNLSHNTKCSAKEGCVHGNSIFERAPYNDVCTYLVCVVLPVWQDVCYSSRQNNASCETIHSGAAFFRQI